MEEALRPEVRERRLQRILLVEERNREPRLAQRAAQQIGVERDVRCREAQRHEQVVYALRQQRAVGNLAGARFLGQDQLAAIAVARSAVGSARVRVHVPISDSDAVGLNRRAAEAGRERVVVLRVDVAAHNAPRFAHVHFVGQVTVVGELVLRQAPLAVLGALGGGDRLIVLQEPNQAEAELGVAVEDFLARRPVAFGVGVVLAGQNRRVHHRLAVWPRVRGDTLAVVVEKFLAAVVRRRLGQHHAVGGVTHVTIGCRL